MMYAKGGHPENRRGFPLLVRGGRMMSGPSTEWPFGTPPPETLPRRDDEGRPAVSPPVPDDDGGRPAPRPEDDSRAGGDQAE